MFGTLLGLALAPVVATADLLDGLSEGEIRTKAALTLGAYAVSGMALSEVIEYLGED